MARYMVTLVQTDWVEAESEEEAIAIMDEKDFDGTEDIWAEKVEDSDGE